MSTTADESEGDSSGKVPEWMIDGTPRAGFARGGRFPGAKVSLEPDTQVNGAWHIFLPETGGGYDIWVDHCLHLLEWIDDWGIELSDD